MANLRKIVAFWQNELQDGIAWVVFWREGRCWDNEYCFLNADGNINPRIENTLKTL